MKTFCGVLSGVFFALTLGIVGSTLSPTRKGGNGVKYKAKTLTPVQVGQVVKALILMGAQKVTVEEVEKDRFVVTTTTETAHSKKV